MKNCLLITLTVLLASSVNGQSCLHEENIDDPAIQLAYQIRKSGETKYQVTMNSSQKVYQGYLLCDDSYLLIDSLNKHIRDRQIDTLLNCPNGSLKVTGFLLYAKRHNDKDKVLKLLNYILQQDFCLMTRSCSGTFVLSNAGRICYTFLTEQNNFFKPEFELTKAEIRTFDNNVSYYEHAIMVQ